MSVATDIISTHADHMSARCAIFHERRISSMNFTSAHIYATLRRVGRARARAYCVPRALADSSDFGLLGSKVPQKMGDSLPRTPINLFAKFDAARFILAGEIRNRTNEQTIKTNSNRYIHTLPNGMCG